MINGMSEKLSQLDAAVPPSREWQYEMRRDAQEVLPRLWCGPFQSSISLGQLEERKITHILCVAESRETHLMRPRFPDRFSYYLADIRDADDQNLIRIFPEVHMFIDNALNAGGSVLVNCCDGISRSPALLTAYIMMKTGLSSEEAFTFLQGRRFCAAPRANFFHQIEAYEPILRAKEAMRLYSAAGSASEPSARSSRRRGRSPDDDGDDYGRGGDGAMDVDDDSVMVHRTPAWQPRELANA